MLEREHRSKIFEKILKDMEEDRAARRSSKRNPKSLEVAPDELDSIRLKAERAAQHGDHATAAQEFERALKVAIRNSAANPIGLIELHLAHGANLQRCGDYPRAKEAFNRAQTIFESGASLSMNEQQVRIEEARGSLAFVSGDLNDATKHYLKAIQIYQEKCTVDMVRLAKLRSELGASYANSGDYDEALETVLEAVDAIESATQPSPENSMRLFKQLANIAFRKDEPNAAVNHLLEAYRHAQLADSPAEMIELEVTLATVYTQHGEYETACQWYEAAISRQESMDSKARWPLSLLYASLAVVQSLNHEEGVAGDCFSRSLDLQLSHLAVVPSTD